MKLIVIIVGLLVSAISVNAENHFSMDETIAQEETSSYTNSSPDDSYKSSKEWKTYKALNITGWCAFGVGVPTTLYGLVGIAYDTQLGGGDPSGMFIAITSVGGVLTLSSIPLLIMAHKYKKKAKLKQFSLDVTDISTRDCFGHNIKTHALSLTYNF